jgi:hypothetical protein
LGRITSVQASIGTPAWALGGKESWPNKPKKKKEKKKERGRERDERKRGRERFERQSYHSGVQFSSIFI